MKEVQTDGAAVTLIVTEELAVSVLRHPEHQYLMSTDDVARGYGVKRNTISSHQSNHREEIKEGVHFIKGVENFDTLPNAQPHQVYWTKAGVIRLGFFIKSERARMFRDWAEQVVLAVTAPKVNLPQARRRAHNRLSKDRLVEILALVAQVEDNDVRRALVAKLVPDLNIPAVQLQLPLGEKEGTRS